MAPKKENSRGKKFQDRQPGEKRPRKTGDAPVKPKKSFGDKPFRSEEKKPFRSSRPGTRDFSDSRSPRGDKPFRPKREDGGFNPEERRTIKNRLTMKVRNPSGAKAPATAALAATTERKPVHLSKKTTISAVEAIKKKATTPA